MKLLEYIGHLFIWMISDELFINIHKHLYVTKCNTPRAQRIVVHIEDMKEKETTPAGYILG